MSPSHSPHTHYAELSRTLYELGLCKPTLVIDELALIHNIEQLRHVLDQGFEHRLVVKSLPSIPLLRYISRATQTNRFMCFHAPFIQHILDAFPDADILLGKPLPARAAEQLITGIASNTSIETEQSSGNNQLDQIQWLIDTEERLAQYQGIAEEHKITLRVSLEIDIGLHRGGFNLGAEYDRVLKRIADSDYLHFSGLMGYEAHAPKIPSLLGGMKKSLSQSWNAYSEYKKRCAFLTTDKTCFNSGGSTTCTEYGSRDQSMVLACNELSVGSLLLKPTDFDLPNVKSFKPGSFIATPVIKLIENISLPGPQFVSRALRKTGSLPYKVAYIYGGNWLAHPCHPAGAKQLSLFGRSSNQELYALPPKCEIQVDDLMLFRPTQSESVLLQFGDIALLTKDQKIEWWPTLSEGSFPC